MEPPTLDATPHSTSGPDPRSPGPQPPGFDPPGRHLPGSNPPGPHPPGPRSRFPGAIVLAMRRDPLRLLTSLARDHGDIARFRLARQPVTFVNHPDLIKAVLVTQHRSFMKGRGLQRAKRLLGEGLLTSEGELHARQRRLSQPAFRPERIMGSGGYGERVDHAESGARGDFSGHAGSEGYGDSGGYGAVMAERARRLRDHWEDGATIDVWREMMRLTLSIVGTTLFATEVEDEADEIGVALGAALGLFNQLMLPWGEALAGLPVGPGRTFRKAKQRLDATIDRMIAEHRAAGVDRGDLLSMLLLAHDELEPGARMSDQQVRDEAITLLLAGHETTAVAMAWTWFLLAQAPQAEAQLHAELDAVLGGRAPQPRDWPRLPYTEMVLTESMRLYPPAWILGRRALVDVELGGYRVPAGSFVIMSQWVAHRDARWYPRPEEFDPQRWAPQARAQRPKFAYFPFGAGPRVCIGESFAWLEMGLVLATLAQRWRLRLVPGQSIAPAPSITLRPSRAIEMVIERRGGTA
jgi:cytochrome P450